MILTSLTQVVVIDNQKIGNAMMVVVTDLMSSQPFDVSISYTDDGNVAFTY